MTQPRPDRMSGGDVAKQREIIGFDLVEFAPIDGFHAYEFSAALLAYKMMGIIERNS
ncbi:MAG: hypothetical protein ACRBBW_01805 [Cellvibrionaceae bacterium]